MVTRAGEMQQAGAGVAAKLTSGVLTAGEQTNLLALFLATTLGGFRVTIDGLLRGISEDWRAITTMTQAATFITSGMFGAATCTWSAGTGQFTLTSTTVGPDGSISYASPPVTGTDLSGATGFKFTAATGAVIAAGSATLGPQWIPCNGRYYSPRAVVAGGPLAATPPYTGTRYDYWLRAGRWAGVHGIGPRACMMRMPYDPSGTWYVSVADNNAETTLTNPPTVQKPPAGVR
jgi:hypothetical protein